MSLHCAEMGGFQHEALLYRGASEGFAAAVAPLVAGTLAAGGCAAVAAPRDHVAPLAGAFGDDARVRLIDMTALGANPGRIIGAWRELADAALCDGAPFLGVGEPVWAGRSADELDQCHHHEALINVAFGADPTWRL